MYWVWLIMFLTNPPLMLLGAAGFLGEEAGKVARDAVLGSLIAFAIACVVGLIYLCVAAR